MFVSLFVPIVSSGYIYSLCKWQQTCNECNSFSWSMMLDRPVQVLVNLLMASLVSLINIMRFLITILLLKLDVVVAWSSWELQLSTSASFSMLSTQHTMKQCLASMKHWHQFLLFLFIPCLLVDFIISSFHY